MTRALPPLLVLTDRAQVPPGRTLVDQVRDCIDGGARAVILREKDLPRDERRLLGESIGAALDEVGGVLIVASDRFLAADLGDSGVHLGADHTEYRRAHDPAATVPVGRDERRRLRAISDGRAVPVRGVSCHRGDDLFEPVDAGAAYFTLSPIFPSGSKPGYGPSLGLDTLRAARIELDEYLDPAEQEAPVRLYALGGIETPELAAACVGAGADGVAVMGALMRAADPAATAAAFLGALDRASRAEATR